MPNKKNIEQVKELTSFFEKAKAIYFTEYHGLNVSDITKLRSMFFKEKIDFKVAKNTLIKIALKNSKINELDKLLSGSTAVAISYEEPVSPAKVIRDFNKVSDLPRVKGILFEGQFFEGEQYKKFADLPSKEELLAKLAMMLASPMVKVATTINSPMQNLANLLHSLKQSK
ncbi:MAG: 50S ribosomal protein L10 [Candidatus Marinimicrobia bacterium]|nr:50S ribosomal protein L10 [Candidatus Neomarinimicrobiota bacterium]